MCVHGQIPYIHVATRNEYKLHIYVHISAIYSKTQQLLNNYACVCISLFSLLPLLPPSLSQSTDAELLGEMMFGSMPMKTVGNTVKVHYIRYMYVHTCMYKYMYVMSVL